MVFTWGSKLIEVGRATEFCQECNQDRSHRVFLAYQFFGVFWIFHCVGKKDYYTRCSKCGAEAVTDAATVEREFPHIPIPTLDRYGWVIFIALVFGLVVALCGTAKLMGPP
jgi:hypothetical protein